MKSEIEKLKKQVVEHCTKKEHGFEVCKMSLLNLQVCSKLPQEEIEKAVNQFSPAGTQNGWRLEIDGNLAPVKCSNGDGSWHYILSC